MDPAGLEARKRVLDSLIMCSATNSNSSQRENCFYQSKQLLVIYSKINEEAVQFFTFLKPRTLLKKEKSEAKSHHDNKFASEFTIFCRISWKKTDSWSKSIWIHIFFLSYVHD